MEELRSDIDNSDMLHPKVGSNPMWKCFSETCGKSYVTLQVMSPRFELMASNPGLPVFWRHRRKFLDLECIWMYAKAMREPEHKYAGALPFITSKIHVLSWWESQRFARFFTRQNRLRVSKTGRAPSSNASFVPGSRGLILGARDLRPKLGFQNEDSENYWDFGLSLVENFEVVQGQQSQLFWCILHWQIDS